MKKSRFVRNIGLIIFGIFSFFITDIQCYAQGYNNPKDIGTEYLRAAMKNDTMILSKVIEPKVLINIFECSKKEGDSSAQELENMVKTNYYLFFSKIYGSAFNKLRNQFQRKLINHFNVDSVSVKKDNGNIGLPSCKDLPSYILKIFITAKQTNGFEAAYQAQIGITKFQGKWFIIDPDTSLF